jgi:FkbM family methyltransferase
VTPHSLTLPGVELEYDHPIDVLGIVEVYVLDVYRQRLLRSGDLVFDVGAGIGDFAIAASRGVGPLGLVVAIEPNPEDFGLLTRNLVRNHVSNVVPFNCAVGQDGGSAQLEFKGRHFSAGTRSIRSLFLEVTRDAPRFSAIDILKLDVEGAEVEALTALGALLDRVRLIPIELHRTRAAVDDIVGPRDFVFEPIGRAAYLRSAVSFCVRHPATAIKLWRLMKPSGSRPTLGKVLRGIDISRGDELSVGIYRRPSCIAY